MVRRRLFLRSLLAVSASVTMAEFFELKQLPANDLRARFGLSPDCDPAITAVASDPGASRITVRVDCLPKTGNTPGEPPRPAGSRK